MNFYFLLFLFFFSKIDNFFSQNVVIKTRAVLDEKSELLLSDSVFKNKSIIFFLPIKNYDTNYYNNIIHNFFETSRVKKNENLLVYKIFFDPGHCPNCGVRVKDSIDSINFIKYPSCFIVGYDEKLAARSLKKNASENYSFKVFHSNIPIAQILKNGNYMCLTRPNGEYDFNAWKPFINELFDPMYNTEERLQLAEEQIQKLNIEYNQLKVNIGQITEIKEQEIINSLILLEQKIKKLEEQMDKNQKKKFFSQYTSKKIKKN
jgi:hypothetical protein